MDREPGHQPADVAGVKTIHIFGGRHGQQNTFAIHLARERKLHQDAIDLHARVQPFDHGEQLFGGNGIGRRDGFGVDAEIPAGFDFIANVNLGCGVVAHQHYRQAGQAPLRRERGHARFEVVHDLIANAISVEDSRHSIQ